MIGLRTMIGKKIIVGVLQAFESMIEKMEEGIKHLIADKMAHLDAIQKSNASVVEIDQNLDKAQRFINKIKSIIE